MIREQGGRVISHDLMERTLREIGKEYRPGLIRWIKEQPDRWAKLLALEDRINQAKLSGDEITLKDALSEYRSFFTEMLSKGGYQGGRSSWGLKQQPVRCNAAQINLSPVNAVKK